MNPAQTVLFLIIFCCNQNFQQFATQYDNPQEWQENSQSNLNKILKYTRLLLCICVFLRVEMIYNTIL